MVTLLIASAPDIASTIQGDALLARGGWTEVGTIEGGAHYAHANGQVHLWWHPKKLLHEDHHDQRFAEAAGIPLGDLREVIYLSRHFAASGQPSLTLHVIGVPGESPVGEGAEYGGVKGAVVAPNPRFAAWYRLMCEAGAAHDLIPEFEMTIETTHHGPTLATPTMFIEIGSSETHWDRRDAAEAWADVITTGLELDGVARPAALTGDWWAMSAEEKAASKVMIGIGGGHYAPRHTHVLDVTPCWLGHALANYALPMEKPEGPAWDPDTGALPEGQWQHAIRIAVDSTRAVFDGAQVMAHLDRKSFKGWQRRVIKRFLSTLDVPVGRTADFA